MVRLKITDIASRDTAIHLIESLNLEDKAWTVEVKQYRRNRTLAQNRLLWMWLDIIAKDTGNDAEKVLHPYFKHEFLGYERSEFLGIETQELPSTTKLNTKEFTEYLDKIDRFVSGELGITLVYPEDVYYEAMGREVESREKAAQGL